MKKLIATVLIALIAFAAFAGISVTLDTITYYSSNKVFDPQDELKTGFRLTGAEPDDNAHGGDVLGEMPLFLRGLTQVSSLGFGYARETTLLCF